MNYENRKYLQYTNYENRKILFCNTLWNFLFAKMNYEKMNYMFAIHELWKKEMFVYNTWIMKTGQVCKTWIMKISVCNTWIMKTGKYSFAIHELWKFVFANNEF